MEDISALTIHLPKDLKDSIQAAIESGQFASTDELVVKIVRAYFRRQRSSQQAQESNMGAIGALRDDAELLDEVVEHAMKGDGNEKHRNGPQLQRLGD